MSVRPGRIGTMNAADVSALAMVISAVMYLVAMVLHACEWASAKGLGATRAADGGEDAARVRVDGFTRMGVAATVLAFLAHAAGVVTRGVAAERLPWGNMYEFVTSALLMAVAIYLILVWRFGMSWLGLFVTLLLAVGQGLAVTVFWVAVAPLVPALHSVWFIVHIVTACIAAAAFNIGGLASVLYLLRLRADERAAKSGVPVTGYLARFDLDRVDLIAYRMTAFAFPVWTFTIAAGAVWAEYAWGRYWNWDPKETWSFVTWVIYAGYLHARSTAGWRGRPAAYIALIGLASFWFNFVGVNLLFKGMHSYAGI